MQTKGKLLRIPWVSVAKEKENNLINQIQDSQVNTEKCPIAKLKYVVHLQSSLIGRINYPGGRSSTSSGYSSGSVSSNNRLGFIELQAEL